MGKFYLGGNNFETERVKKGFVENLSSELTTKYLNSTIRMIKA